MHLQEVVDVSHIPKLLIDDSSSDRILGDDDLVRAFNTGEN